MSQDSLKSKILHVLQIQFYVLYLVFHFVQEFIRNQYRAHYGPKEQPGKVLVSRILWKQKLDPEEISKRQDFITTEGEWIDWEILDNPCWHIYCAEKDRVFFVLLPREISYYSVGNFPFMFVPVHDEALAVAEVQKSVFLQLSKRFASRPHPKTVLFTNTARCGSTLMAKMLDRPGNSVCFGEPHTLTNLSIALGEETMSEKEVTELLEATVVCLRAHVPVDQVCVLKTTSSEARLVPLCKNIPDLKHMFMFRKKGLPSVEKIVRREEFMTSIFLNLYMFSPVLCRLVSMLTTIEGPTVRNLKPKNIRMYSAIIYGAPYSYYQKNKEAYCHPVVWYHEVIEDTKNTLTKLFNSIGLPEECVEEAIACKLEDSQKNSFLSRDVFKKVKIPAYTDEDRVALKEYSSSMNLPEDTFDC